MAQPRTPDALPAVASQDPGWLRQAASSLDPRVRAALDVSGPGGQEVMGMTDQAARLLSAAMTELSQDPLAVRGVAPVLGAGVVAEFLKHRKGDAAANHGAATSSKIDAKR